MKDTGKSKKARVIAFYLPQFHPIPENDLWWGKGFTEWTNVTKGRPLFRGHKQPHVPADLGYYDLLDPQVRLKQAELAREAGVDGFCYWHYWFGNGRQLLEKPLQEVIRLGQPDFPFCLGWANHNWEKKLWNSEISPLSKQLLAKQLYPGVEDIDRHFYAMLPAFKDPRYMRIDNRLIFLVYTPHENPLMQTHIERWQELAVKEGLGGFYFIAQCRRKEELDMYRRLPFDALNYDCLFYFFNTIRMYLGRFWEYDGLTTPQNILQSTLGYEALLRLLVEILRKERIDIFNKNSFIPFIEKIADIPFDNTDRFPMSTKGRNILSLTMSLSVFPAEDSDDERVIKLRELESPS